MFKSSEIFIKVSSDSKEVKLKWSLSSNSIVKDGEVELVNEPTFDNDFAETDKKS